MEGSFKGRQAEIKRDVLHRLSMHKQQKNHTANLLCLFLSVILSSSPFTPALINKAGEDCGACGDKGC